MPAAYIIDPTPTLSRDEAIEWIISLADSIGPGFHPDTPAADYPVAMQAGICARLDARMRAAFNVLGDEVYDIANVHSPRRRSVRAA